MLTTSFYGREELAALGFHSYGEKVLISRKTSIYRPDTIQIGSNVRIDDFCILSGGDGGIRIGNFVHIACYSALFGAAGIEMHDFSGLSSRVVLYSEADDFSGRSLTNPTVPRQFRPGLQRGRIILNRHALVGTNTTLLPGVVMEEGAAVGAHSLVMRNCKAWMIYFGAPAKPVKARAKDLLDLESAFENSIS